MIKFSYFLQVFLQVIFAQQILSSAIFQLRLADLQSLVTDRQQEARRAIEEVLHRDGAFVSKHHRCQRNFANVFTNKLIIINRCPQLVGAFPDYCKKPVVLTIM